MRMLKLLILPLIVTSLIVSLADLDQKSSGKLGRRAVLYFLGTTFLAVTLGVVLVSSIQPGNRTNDKIFSKKKQIKVRTIDNLLDLIRNMFLENIIQACIEQLRTSARYIKANVENNTYIVLSNATIDETLTKYNSTHSIYYKETFNMVKVPDKATYYPGTNILGIVVFSVAIGIVLGKLASKAKVFIIWMSTLNEVVTTLVNIVMWYSPIGIWSLITSKFASMKDISGTFESLGLYMATVITGLVIHSFIILPLTYFIFTRKNPFTYLKGTLQALLTAFGTSSSSATLPVTFCCLEDKIKLDKRVTRFVLPIGATINMDGTALYEAVAAIYIAQATGHSLNFGQYIAISLTATLTSIGAAGIPQAGLVTMLIVLQTVGLPEEAVPLIISVDWFLDRIRTTVNVLGDCIGAGIVEHLSRDDLTKTNVLKAFEDEVENIELGVRNISFVSSPEDAETNSYLKKKGSF